MEAAAVELHGAIGQHGPADAVGGKPVKRLVGGAFGHDQFAWRHRKRIDDPLVVGWGDLDGAHLQLLQLLEEGKGQAEGIDQRQVMVDHQERAVDVDVVADEIDGQQIDPLALENLRHLCGALAVDADAAADHCGLRIDPGEAAAFHQRRTGQGAEDGNAEPGQGAGDGQLLAAADARAHAANDGTALDHDERIARVAGLEPPAIHTVDDVDLDAAGLQCGHEGIVLGLHFGKRRHAVALEVPARCEIAKGADALDPLGGIDDIHFRTGTMHEDGANFPHVIVDPPGATPVADEFALILEGRIARGGEHANGLVVDPSGRCTVGHA